jgi:hypothetical protein
LDVEKDVITTVQCSYCGVVLDPYLTLKAKKYLWLMCKRGNVYTLEEWNFFLRQFLPNCFNCNDGVVGDCACTSQETCNGCGLYINECVCSDYEEGYED